jgi:glycosyltransferase involved in cell wall biosynthesis
MTICSVIITAYNEEKWILQAVNSVINQTVKDIEIIVVDDSSTDETYNIVNDISDKRLITIQHKDNLGGSAARNTGINHSTGKYCAFLDGDDYWHPEKLEVQISNLEQNKEYMANYCNITHQSESTIQKIYNLFKRNSVPDEGGEEIIPHLLSREFDAGGASTLIAERQFINKIGKFDEDFDRHQDWEFLLRVLKHGKISFVDSELVTRRDTGGPPMEVQSEAMKKYLSKYSDEVVNAELQGYPVTKRHLLSLSRHHIRNGNYRNAMRTLLLSRPHSILHYCKFIVYTFIYIWINEITT